MALSNWHKRFLGNTRGKIVLLLRHGRQTVEELAQALNLTDNAVRAHLATLERDRLVRQGGARRGNSKPAYVYELTSEAEDLFPKAYGLVLHQLLDVLSTSMTPGEMEGVLRSVGRNIAARWNMVADDLTERLGRAVEALNELGGLAELDECDEHSYQIRGYSCPLAAAIPGHPEVCHLTEALITELTGQPVQEQCQRGEGIHCCFTIPRP